MDKRSHCTNKRHCRVHQVSERIYKNHLKTRFCNQQEQYKLKSKIVELERLEKDSWVALNNRKKELQNRFTRINAARRPYLVQHPDLYNTRVTINRTKNNSISDHHHHAHQQQKLQPGRPQRKPSYTSLLNPYRTDELEYKEVLGYAQHLTKKKTRKSSTVQTDIQFEDLNQGQYQRRSIGKDQRMILHGLKQSAKELISMGLINPHTQINRKAINRKISFLPPAPIMEEENHPRYVRIPVSPIPSTVAEEDTTEMSDLHDLSPPPITYAQQLLQVDGVVTSENLPNILHAQRRGSRRSSLDGFSRDGLQIPALPYPGRRGSRSLCEVEMRKYLPYLGRCPSPVNGLDDAFNDRLNLFNKKMIMTPLTKDTGIELVGGNDDIAHIAPPPRDDLFNILVPANVASPTSQTVPSPTQPVPSPTQDEAQDSETGKYKSTRISKVDRFELGKWRQTMALADTLPNINKCKYLRKPSDERFDPETNQYYELDAPDTEYQEQTHGRVDNGAPKVHMMDVVAQLLHHVQNTDSIEEEGCVDEEGERENPQSQNWV